MKRDGYRQTRVIILTVVAILLLAILLIALDWKEVRQVVDKAEWQLTLIALFFTAVSYLCLGSGYVLVNRAFGIKLGWRDLFEIGFVSATVSNIVAFFGAARHSLRLVLIRRKGIATGEVLAASIFHSYINNVVMLLMLVSGLIYLLASGTAYGGSVIGLGLVSGMFVLLLVVATAILFVSPLRLWVLHTSNAVWHFVTRRDITSFLNDFDNAMRRGVAVLRGRCLALVLILGLVAADWVFTVAVLWSCFGAFGNAPGPGVLMSGFGIGILVGNLSMVPGGLGVQEASMSGVYALLGTPFTQAVLSSILFRVVYEFIPFFVSLMLYRRLIQGISKADMPTD